MQKDVKVFIPEMLVEIFPELTVKVEGDVFKHYNLHTKVIDHIQLVKLAEVQKESNVNLVIRRYGKGLTIRFTPKDLFESCEPKLKLVTVRDFYEYILPEDARVAAFANTSKMRIDHPADSLSHAILQSFRISDTDEGATYWQDVILQNS